MESVIQRFETSVYFRCPLCGSSDILQIEVPEFDFNVERFSELSSEGQVDFICPSCENEFSGFAQCNSSECVITLNKPEGIMIHGDTPFYSPPEDDGFWVNYVPPESPFSIFTATIENCFTLLKLKIELTQEDKLVVNRMVFIQIFSAFEAYLSDTLIKNVVGDLDRIKKLVSKDREISKIKFSLQELIDNENIINSTVKQYLVSIIYHNLNKVNFLYKVCIGIEIVTSKSDWEFLLKGVEYRHDCIHRNGYTKDGIKLDIFNDKYIEDITDKMNLIVSKIEDALIPF